MPGAWTASNTDVEHNFIFSPAITSTSFRIYSTDATLRVKELALYPPNAGSSYDSWKVQITNGQDGRTQDADGDGFSNLHEFLFGTTPASGNGALVTTTASGGNLVLRWLQRESGSIYTLKQSSTLAAGSWTTVVSPSPAMDGNQTGAPADYDFHTVTLPTGSGSMFFRVEGVEN